jgi:hypothetical protein
MSESNGGPGNEKPHDEDFPAVELGDIVRLGPLPGAVAGSTARSTRPAWQ